MTPLMGTLFSAMLVFHADSCSTFYMNFTKGRFRLSGRTNDESHPSASAYIMHGIPRGRQASYTSASWTSKYGYLAFTPLGDDAPDPKNGVNPYDFVEEGLNEKGLSCGYLFLLGTEYEQPDLLNPEGNIPAYAFCKWALENFALAADVRAAMASKRFISVPGGMGDGQHMVVQDRDGKSLVVEFPGGKRVVYMDENDGVHGFGITTNEPGIQWQVENAKHLDWKRSLERSSVAIPGDFYPDERFLRVHMIRQGIESSKQPTTLREAVATTAAVLNTVTIPAGGLPGTDGSGDHTQWGVIRDHINAAYYLRSESNPSFRKIELSNLDLQEGAAVTTMEVEQGPWFLDATSALQADGTRPTVHV